jgi:sigma-E factor negative regulatory protein RseA
MTQDKEQFSAWLDDAAAADGMQNASSDDESSVLGLAARYRLIGDALRGEIEDNSMSDISASVRAAIESEPAYHHTATPTPVRPRPVKNRKPFFDFGSWLRPVGGLALAASVAMVVVVTVTRQETPVNGGAVVAVSEPPPSLAVPVSYPANPALPARGYAASQMAANPVANLNDYMEEHSEYASQDTMQRIMPYARAVSYENPR